MQRDPALLAGPITVHPPHTLRQEIEEDMGSVAYCELWEEGRAMDLHQTANHLLNR